MSNFAFLPDDFRDIGESAGRAEGHIAGDPRAGWLAMPRSCIGWIPKRASRSASGANLAPFHPPSGVRCRGVTAGPFRTTAMGVSADVCIPFGYVL